MIRTCGTCPKRPPLAYSWTTRMGVDHRMWEHESMGASQAASRTYAMPERSDRLDFYIRDQASRPAIEEPHKHEYSQIQMNLGGDTEQHISGVCKPFPAGAVAFILPHRLHLIPDPAHSRFMIINFTQGLPMTEAMLWTRSPQKHPSRKGKSLLLPPRWRKSILAG